MSVTLKDLMEMKGLKLEDVVAESKEEENNKEDLHRVKKVERPSTRAELLSIYKDSDEYVRSSKDHTEDLLFVDKSVRYYQLNDENGYFILDVNTNLLWYAHDEICLNKNFIYRGDLIIKSNKDEDILDWIEGNLEISSKTVKSKKCYILDNPANETYEVFYEPTYPLVNYGKPTPQGCIVHMYANRFYRDIAILELDEMYSNSSLKEAGKFTGKKLKDDEVIIISDGCYAKESCASTFFYIDNAITTKCVTGFLPSDMQQAVLVSEIKSAYNALQMCLLNKKKKITYYYDNSSIVNVFKNRKTEYIVEIKEYKELVDTLYINGYSINFVELHPKTGEDRDKENKALLKFHNICDSECYSMTDLYSRSYADYAANGNTDGKGLKKIKEEEKARVGRSKNSNQNNRGKCK